MDVFLLCFIFVDTAFLLCGCGAELLQCLNILTIQPPETHMPFLLVSAVRHSVPSMARPKFNMYKPSIVWQRSSQPV